MPELIVAEEIADEGSRQFLAAAPRTVALAGGQTPRPLYEKLATLTYAWSMTEFFFGDERCVPLMDPESNYRMAWDALLSKVPSPVHAMTGNSCDAELYEQTLERKFGPGVPRFDLVFLGLGADGHTASLFPGSPALAEQKRTVVSVDRPDHQRLTLTMPVLCAAKLAIFLVAGAGKQKALRQLLHGDDIPASRVRAERVLVIADREATAGS